ncbi:MAG: hypothetical protein MZV64_10760 [Ignavibacteriales bacterium]|nr:hypothetical protein [Ignavibacteriales bacterium]
MVLGSEKLGPGEGLIETDPAERLERRGVAGRSFGRAERLGLAAAPVELGRGPVEVKPLGLGQGATARIQGERPFAEEARVGPERGGVVRQDPVDQGRVAGLEVPGLEDAEQTILVPAGQRLLEKGGREVLLFRFEVRPEPDHHPAHLVADLAVVAREAGRPLVLLERAERRRQREVAHIEEGLGEVEVDRGRSGIEPDRAEKGLRRETEQRIACRRLGQGLGAALEVGLAELEMDGRVPGEHGVGAVKDTDLFVRAGDDRLASPAEPGVDGHGGLEDDEDRESGEQEDLFHRGDLRLCGSRP